MIHMKLYEFFVWPFGFCYFDFFMYNCGVFGYFIMVFLRLTIFRTNYSVKNRLYRIDVFSDILSMHFSVLQFFVLIIPPMIGYTAEHMGFRHEWK